MQDGVRNARPVSDFRAVNSEWKITIPDARTSGSGAWIAGLFMAIRLTCSRSITMTTRTAWKKAILNSATSGEALGTDCRFFRDLYHLEDRGPQATKSLKEPQAMQARVATGSHL